MNKENLDGIPGTIMGTAFITDKANAEKIAKDIYLEAPDYCEVLPLKHGYGIKIYLEGDTIGDWWRE